MRIWPFRRRVQPDVRALARLGEEVKWLQGKFDALLAIQQRVLESERDLLSSLQSLRERVGKVEKLVLLGEKGEKLVLPGEKGEPDGSWLRDSEF